MNIAQSPKEGLCVSHLFFQTSTSTPIAQVETHLNKFSSGDQCSYVPVAINGHKADLCVMAMAPDFWQLRGIQTDLVGSGLELVDSYSSMTELSEYASELPETMKQDRLYPNLPPEGLSSWCFYPMSKARHPMANWYTQDYESRETMMREHGASGRKFKGRIVQLITGSTGVDDYEWGVTLFGAKPDDLKAAVYSMRFDEASAKYGDFGRFYVGTVSPLGTVLSQLGIGG